MTRVLSTLSVLLLGQFILFQNAGADKLDAYKIDQVLFAASYLDGGSTSIVGIARNNFPLYLFIPPYPPVSEDNKAEIALLGNENLLMKPDVWIPMIDGLSEWMFANMDGNSIQEILGEFKKGIELSKTTRDAVVVYGFLEGVCAGHSFREMYSRISETDTCINLK